MKFRPTKETFIDSNDNSNTKVQQCQEESKKETKIRTGHNGIIWVPSNKDVLLGRYVVLSYCEDDIIDGWML